MTRGPLRSVAWGWEEAVAIRFSGECPGPRESTADRLSRQRRSRVSIHGGPSMDTNEAPKPARETRDPSFVYDLTINVFASNIAQKNGPAVARESQYAT